MYRLHPTDNQLIELTETTFADNDIKERQHIEEWIRKSPEVLGEDLLIIGHEYDKFEVNERLDLLALDKDGNVVIIEVKRDTSGSDVDFQALKYASYCARLSQQDILDIYTHYIEMHLEGVDAKQSLLEFLEAEDEDELNAMLNGTQRIIIVGKEFDKRILSVCTWLYENSIDIKCVSIKPYKLNDELIVDTKQIIPPYKLENYYIRKRTEKQKRTIQGDKDVIEFLQAVEESITTQTNYSGRYGGQRNYFKGHKLLGIPWHFVFSYKKDGTALISLESSVSEGTKIIKYIKEKHFEQLKETLGIPIELSEGVKNKDWLRLIAKLNLEVSLPLEERVQEYINVFVKYYNFIQKLKVNHIL
ncbi:hypothetical protein [Ornithinibacillus bavariensis]|uniref:hypothetical protein n=1 Tax=Ornithinibacillus bavariensis TaxID=545502 RepID=UPI000EEC0F70|nr:hypothetical protein [Ornithinibacillus sp.]